MKPLPQPDYDTAPFWEAAARHELVIQRCDDCQTFVHYPRGCCWRCGSENLGWSRVSGHGAVHTFVVVHHKVLPGFESPYVVALVDLEEQSGLRLVTNILYCDPREVHCDMPVEVVFEDIAEGVALPQFRPLGTEATHGDQKA